MYCPALQVELSDAHSSNGKMLIQKIKASAAEPKRETESFSCLCLQMFT